MPPHVWFAKYILPKEKATHPKKPEKTADEATETASAYRDVAAGIQRYSLHGVCGIS